MIRKTWWLIVALLLAAFCVQAQDSKFHRVNPHKNIFKVTYLSWVTGSTKLSYERYLFNNQTIEVTGGVIGWGNDKYKVSPKGGIFRVAYKFILSNKNGSALQGFYLRPEFAYTSFNYDSEEVVGTRINSSMGTVMGTVGYQWCSHVLVLDGFVGAGVGLGNPTESTYHHSFIDVDQWLTLTFGLKIGFTFGK